MNAHPDDRDRFDLEARLRADAATWGQEVAPELRARLRTVIPGRRRLLPWVAAALALVGTTLTLVWPRPQTPAPMTPRIDVAQLEAMALAPLKQELAFVMQDGRAVARGVFRGLWPIAGQ